MEQNAIKRERPYLLTVKTYRLKFQPNGKPCSCGECRVGAGGG